MIQENRLNVDISTWFYTGSFNNGTAGQVTANYDFQLDWGDGSKLEHYDNSMANENRKIPVRHSYSQAGIYRVTITGTCDNLYGYDGNVYAGNKQSAALVHGLWGIIVPKDSFSPLKYAYGSFFGCQNLKHVGYGVFHNITECREVPHLYDGAILSRIEPWMLYGGEKIESVEYTFENCQMLEIDPDIFKNCPNITNAAHCFHRCDSLLSIPPGLFKYNTKLTNVDTCFKSCTSVTTVPIDLFDTCPEINDANQCFCGGGYGGDTSYITTMAITSSIPPLWNRTDKNIRHGAYAHGCTKAKNYNIANSLGWA